MVFFWVYAPCLGWAFRSFGGKQCFHLPPEPASFTMKMEAVRSTEPMEYTYPARHRDPIQDHQVTKNCREKLKTYSTSNS